MEEISTPEVEPELEVEETPEEPYESESARYIRIRAEAKAKAAVTMKKEAQKAEKLKRDSRRGAPVIEGQAEFNKRAKEIEKQINASSTTEADPKGE